MAKIITKDTRMKNLLETKHVDIEFHDLCFNITQGRKAQKSILHNISGKFKAGRLHAIMGASGAGKSTLLNILAAYKVSGSTGNILINGEPRNIRNFRKISRYIMQEDVVQPLLTVDEIMMIAANLKLGKDTSVRDKESCITEILELLRLTGTRNTHTQRLSGGEKKRLSISLELINNPPVIFLDEPTTGLDDLSSYQCITLLKKLAEGGRTVICSIHTPSARMFSLFDNVYILEKGLCVYQGYGPDVVQFLSNIGLTCPTHYNPADFIIEVCSGEYGDHTDVLVAAVDNGRCLSYYKRNILQKQESIVQELEGATKNLEDYTYESSWWMQFTVLLQRMWLQMYRDKVETYLMLRVVVTIIISIVIGNLYFGMGQDASKVVFNFGFYYTCIIKFLYIPMMPVLLSFPAEIQLIKREFFNKWYRLTPYFCAMTVSTIPMTLILGIIYVGIVYTLTGQPLDGWARISQFYCICMITALISESMGLLISSTLNVVNSTFTAPVAAVPLMLLAVYGWGQDTNTPIPPLIKFAMNFSFLRWSLDGIVTTMSANREILPCPEEEEFCMFRDLIRFSNYMSLGNGIYWLDVSILILNFVIFRFVCFYLLKQRLTPNKLFRIIKYALRNIKFQLNLFM